MDTAELLRRQIEQIIPCWSGKYWLTASTPSQVHVIGALCALGYAGG